ncbi:hypothetical protein GCM10023084_07670 [Streptomyces lacrimifluminis]|uniref:Uncharacterized protein n=1 Tax=Streptomyces lacrimifluminis TaxID=1500077 RepID=A0A917KSP7_9ACTN|nr:hypothetical protein GCM10012282_22210 [Streptomyces lacrimifluminis]
MVTHSKEFYVRTTVIVPMIEGNNGGWMACPELPDVLGEDTVRSCGDLRLIVETQGGVVAHLLRAIAQYTGFRLLVRDRRTGALAGSVEWVRNDAGVWVQWDEPVTACAYGQHRPTVLLAA